MLDMISLLSGRATFKEWQRKLRTTAATAEICGVDASFNAALAQEAPSRATYSRR